jgi:cobalt-zinc-cadmium efflux system membrane fusion protein
MTLLWIWMLGCSLPTGPSAVDGHDDHEDHEEGPRVVELTPKAITSARIVVSLAEERTLTKNMSLPARITLDPRREAIVSAWIAGQVDTITVRPGEPVKKGQRLAQVQSPDLGTAVAAFRTAQARDQAADARLERLKRLEADGVSSRAQVLEAEADHAEAEGALEAAEERLRILGIPLKFGDPHKGEHFPSRVPVRSPIAGTVLTATASVGERVDPGQPLFRVGALDEVWLLLDLYERDLAAVSKGQSVKFSVEAWPGETFEGEVAQVGDWIEPDARTVEVRVVVANPEHKLKPNMFATAQLSADTEVRERGIVLPTDAVQQIDGADVVFVEGEAGHFEARNIVVAERTPNRVRLGSGLEPGERVVTEGAFALRSELEKGELGEGHAH